MTKKGAGDRRLGSSLAKAELRDEGGVALAVGLAEIIQQGAALVDEHQEAAAGMVVLRVRLEMLGEVLDALGENGDLHLGGTGVALRLGVVFDNFLLALGGHRHRQLLYVSRLKPRTTRSDPSASSTSA